jgi:folate-binding protein YgfZ
MQNPVLAAATEQAAVFRASGMGTVAVTGKDGRSWLNGLVTSDLSKLAPGAASYGLVLVKVGRIVTDVWIVSAGDRLLLGAPADRIALLREHLERYLMMEDAAHEDVSPDFGWVFAHGPRAAELSREAGGRHGGFGGAVDVTGLGGGAMVVPAGHVDELLRDLSGHAGVVLGSEEDWEALRVLRSFPKFGVDFGEKNYPQEASLEKIAVSFQKGCYLGQEVVCTLEMRGRVSKKIVPVDLAGAEPPPAGAEVKSRDGKVVGSVSSAVPSEQPGRTVALAMLRRDAAEPGTEVEIEGRVGNVG